MQPMITFLPLLAVNERFEGLRSAFDGNRSRLDAGDMLFGVFVLVAAVLVVWGLSALINYHERRRTASNPWFLLFSLCRAHRLPWSDWWLLLRLARLQRLGHPARLFLEPERFDPAAIPLPLRAQRARLKALASRLFADLSEEPPREAPPPKPSAQDTPTETPLDGKTPPPPTAAPPPPILPMLDIPPWSSQEVSTGGSLPEG